MKKLLAILLLLVYTAASSGTVMSAHFCMGELAGISIGEKNQDACGYCGMEDAGCCHDLQQVVKIDGTQLEKSSTPSLDVKLFTCTKVASAPLVFKVWSNEPKNIATSLALRGSPPLYLKNCVFRI